MPAAKPQRLTLRAYQVGFGDCFLLTFHYATKDRHVLIDFGSTGTPATAGEKLLLRVANDIKSECGGKLHAVVATHRHADHISGFATNKSGTAPGDIIASCAPDVVVQPWTEHPDADPETGSLRGIAPAHRAFTSQLRALHQVSQAVLAELEQRKTAFSTKLRGELSFLGEDNLTNRSAVENLLEMGRRGKACYVHYGEKSGLETVLPGVKVRVLGPPNLEQSETIRQQRSKDESEFWHLQAQAGQFVTQSTTQLFPKAKTVSASHAPPFTRWFLKRCRTLRGEQLLGIVRALDKVMNNTSLILLFEAGSKKLLFPGDAQIENWSYALHQSGIKELLADVNLYKVGHHGSLNATPKTLWNGFSHCSEDKNAPDRLQTVVSTMPGKHGTESSNTEVPRRTLVKALTEKSNFFSTQELKDKDQLRHDIVIDL